MPAAMSDEERRLMASDASPFHTLAKVTDGVMPAVMELTDGGVPPDGWAKSIDGRVPSKNDDERLLTASDGPPLHSQATVTVGARPAVTHDECQLTASDGSPMHSLAYDRATVIQSVNPRLRRLSAHAGGGWLTASDGSPLQSQANVTDGAMPAATHDERQLTASDGSPLQS